MYLRDALALSDISLSILTAVEGSVFILTTESFFSEFLPFAAFTSETSLCQQEGRVHRTLQQQGMFG